MKDTVRYIFYILLILVIGVGAAYIGRIVNRKYLGIERHDETIKELRDSLNSFIKSMIRLLMNNNLLLIVLEELNKNYYYL